MTEPRVAIVKSFRDLCSRSDVGAAIAEMSGPVALCDDRGILRSANREALRWFHAQMGVTEVTSLRLKLTGSKGEIHQRRFLSQVMLQQYRGDEANLNFDREDGSIWDALGVVDLKLTRLPSGINLVRFVPDANSSRVASSKEALTQRFMRQMVALNQSVDVLSSTEEVVACQPVPVRGVTPSCSARHKGQSPQPQLAAQMLLCVELGIALKHSTQLGL